MSLSKQTISMAKTKRIHRINKWKCKQNDKQRFEDYYMYSHMGRNFSYGRGFKFLHYTVKATSPTGNKNYCNQNANNQHHKYQSIHENELNNIHFSRYWYKKDETQVTNRQKTTKRAKKQLKKHVPQTATKKSATLKETLLLVPWDNVE